MFIELHMIQNFAPSNLNRDDASAPKDCVFGGCRRARISSQCQKRAIRTVFRDDLLPADDLAVRTRRVAAALAERLTVAGHQRSDCEAIVRLALRGTCLELGPDSRSKCLMFVGERELAALAAIISEFWGPLNDALREGSHKPPAELRAALMSCLDGGRAVDLALFGRMVADLPVSTITGACQIAHALSTHQVSPELDFFTAVDDLRPGGSPGAELMGTLQFNSACFYRYANLDLSQLAANLQGDRCQAINAAELFLRAAVMAVPTGRQASWAAHNPPSLIFIVVRDGGLWSLANAFADPIRPTADGDLVRASGLAMLDYWRRLARMYGDAGIRFAGLAAVDAAVADQSGRTEAAPIVPISLVSSCADLIAQAIASVGPAVTGT